MGKGRICQGAEAQAYIQSTLSHLPEVGSQGPIPPPSRAPGPVWTLHPCPTAEIWTRIGWGGWGSGIHTPNLSRQNIPPLNWPHHSKLRGWLEGARLSSSYSPCSQHAPVLSLPLVVASLLRVEAVGPWEGETPASTSLPLAKGQSAAGRRGIPAVQRPHAPSYRGGRLIPVRVCMAPWVSCAKGAHH